MRRWIFSVLAKRDHLSDPIVLFLGQALSDDDVAEQIGLMSQAFESALPQMGEPAKFVDVTLNVRPGTTAEDWSVAIKKYLIPGTIVTIPMSEEMMRRAVCPECHDHYPTHKPGCNVAKAHGLQ